MYEHRTEPLIPRARFIRRLWDHFVVAFGIVAGSLLLGAAGYHFLARFSWIDSVLNASMLLGGMGPMGEIPTTSGKMFASGYALYAGVVFIAASGILLAPLLHRVMHRLHLDQEGNSK